MSRWSNEGHFWFAWIRPTMLHLNGHYCSMLAVLSQIWTTISFSNIWPTTLQISGIPDASIAKRQKEFIREIDCPITQVSTRMERNVGEKLPIHTQAHTSFTPRWAFLGIEQKKSIEWHSEPLQPSQRRRCVRVHVAPSHNRLLVPTNWIQRAQLEFHFLSHITWHKLEYNSCMFCDVRVCLARWK